MSPVITYPGFTLALDHDGPNVDLPAGLGKGRGGALDGRDLGDLLRVEQQPAAGGRRPGTFPGQQQSIPPPYPGIVPQQQQPYQYMAYPGEQHGVARLGTNPVQAAQMPPTAPQYHTATPIAALGRSSAPLDCPCCGQRSLTSIDFIVGNTTQ